MLILVTYDVNTESPAGQKRLRKVAKKCMAHGQRVQNSVFECLLDAAQLAVFEHELVSLINQNTDSLRIYVMGNKYKGHIRQYGVQNKYKQEDVLVL